MIDPYVIGADLALVLLGIGIGVYEMRWRAKATDSINSLKIKAQMNENIKTTSAMSNADLDAALANDLGRAAPIKPGGG